MRVMAFAAMVLLALPGVAAAQQVGVTAAVNQSATSLAPAQKPKIVQLGDQVIHNEKISTNGKGLLQILLVDGTTFTVGPNSTMTIDKFVYDPDAGTAQVVATLSKGAFRFIGGKSSKAPDGVTLNTPVGTVGVRGGISNLDFTDAKAYHIDMVYGDGITLKDGTQVIGNLYHSGYSMVIGASGKVQVEKTPPEFGKTFQALMTGNGGQGGGGKGTVQAGKVQTALAKTNEGAPPLAPAGNVPAGNGAQQVASNSTPDDSKVPDKPPDGPLVPGGITTLRQVENSDLASVTATYDGMYAAHATITDGDQTGSTDISGVSFQLQYAFALENGLAKFAQTGGEPIDNLPDASILTVPVTPSDPTHTGLAGFAYSGPLTGVPIGGTITTHADLQGYFVNTDNGAAGAVAGTFGAQVTVPGHGGPASLDFTGAFGGTLTSTTPAIP